MKILITGANGFIGKNLVAELHNQGFHHLLTYDRDSGTALLDEYTRVCDFVFHLAGVNRPENESDFMSGNYNFTSVLLESLKKHNNASPVLITSSVQAALENPYGKSKKAAEEQVFRYGENTGVPVYVYRLPNVFGKWCRPDYNSVIATFCHHIANGQPITVNDDMAWMNLVYIDDVVASFMDKLKNGKANHAYPAGYESVKPVYTIKLGEIASMLYRFKDSRQTLFIPDMSHDFTRKLYATYLSYLPSGESAYPLTMHADTRGSFTEFLKSYNRGQVSVNVIKPGAVKGNHWHHTKNEKFLVVSGSGVIRLKNLQEENVVEYLISGEKPEVVDIPVGTVHHIENSGDKDMVIIIWGSELFDKETPDTYFSEIELTLKETENEKVESNDRCRYAS